MPTSAIRQASPRPRAGRVAARLRHPAPSGRWWRGPVADATHGHDVARLVRVVAELVPQAPDVDVDRPVEHLLLAAAVDRVEELVAGECPPVGCDERDEQPELHGRQRDELLPAPDLVALHVDDQVALRQEVVVSPSA